MTALSRSNQLQSTRRGNGNSYAKHKGLFHNNDPPIPTQYLREMLGLILTKNSFEFNGNDYLQTHWVAMGTKTAVSFANIYKAEIETN